MAEVDRLDHVVCILTSCKRRRYKDERRIREKTRGRQESSFEVSMKRERGQKKRGGRGGSQGSVREEGRQRGGWREIVGKMSQLVELGRYKRRIPLVDRMYSATA